MMLFKALILASLVAGGGFFFVVQPAAAPAPALAPAVVLVPVSVMQKGLPPSVNPYCGQPPGDPPSGPIECDEDEEVSEPCLAACQDGYTSNVIALLALACGFYTNIQDEYDMEMLAAWSDYADCLFENGSNCSTVYYTATQVALANRLESEATLANSVGDFMDQSIEAFWNCANGCCVKRAKK